MNCLWYETGNGNEKLCYRCDNRLVTDNSIDKCFANCKASNNCIHRSANSVRTEQCASCGGNVQIKVFACSIHKECTLSKKLNGIACCESCKDFSSA